ncbi:DEAD/DEAH box helicase family protein [Romeria aff. gracilis LEGE 07310]|uniref:DNA 3'-5' helicase n=1 Tax=Vasconcelosia minhoensis LEGE 07310 TaxID=915328 RepID=A0A8J7DPU6_9CYAN|nr:DEAD/DEAH box helicase family protein [Romeria gracilis]MBE9080315.1 DEAD/DEAH box helicase family protein [Romeria aff. gracilis LEGE 07310]
MARTPTLKFDRGTLILHPPPRGKAWIDYAVWDDRVERFRVPANQYRRLVEALKTDGVSFDDQVQGFEPLTLNANLTMTPYAHQREALQAWIDSRWCGVVVLPTAAGKTYLAQLAMQTTPRSTLITVPTLDLMHQWYAQLEAAFPGVEIGLLGGGSRDRTSVLVATYDSAAIHAETLGNQYALLICDECHHLPSDFNRVIAEYSIAPYRLGLTATPDRADGRHADLDTLLGPVVYAKTAAELSGKALAPYEIVPIKVPLSLAERDRYSTLIQQRNDFLQKSKIWLSSTQGWQRFVQASARSPAGRRAMLAHREAKNIALGTAGKLKILDQLLDQHYPDPTLIFTNDNATVYRISQDFLIPAITHQTPVKERHTILQKFRTGEYRVIVVSHVLNEGVDVPEARIAILLSGSGSTREYVQRLGRVLRKGDGQKTALLYEVIAEETTEENISRRRKPASPERQLELVTDKSPYDFIPDSTPNAAEVENQWE